MCGICGAIKTKGQAIQMDALLSATRSLSHRGPNDEGVYIKGNVGLGHRRLSIIDLDSGHQPLHNEDQTIWLVCNGEIYNYRELTQQLKSHGHKFHSKSDSEVIIHLYEEYGERCVEYLNGIFAFALYDEKTETLFCARDQLGVKPLFYFHDQENFYFGSEIKSLCQFPNVKREINPTALFHYFSLNYTPSPLTVFKDIESLQAGHTLICKEGKVQTRQYWDVKFEGQNGFKEADIEAQLQNQLDESVKMQLVSDVPVGAFLSGGLDSSLIIHFIKKNCSQQIKTFNVRFKEKTYDESSFAQLTAKYYETDHYEIFCEPKDYLNHLPDIVWGADNLTIDVSMLSLFLVSKLASEHVKVVIAGDGADELFAGYPTYLASQYAQHYRRLPSFMSKGLIPFFVNRLPVSEKKMSFDFKARRFIQGAQLSPEEAHFSWRNIFSKDEKNSLLDPQFLKGQEQDTFWAYDRYYQSTKDWDHLNRHLYADMKVWMVDSILAKVDLMSMANSLEVRVPYLNHKFVEFAAKIPSAYKLKNSTSKYILRKAMKGLAPKTILQRPKAGFNIPYGKWLRHELKPLMTDILTKDSVRKTQCLQWSYVQNLLDEHISLKRDHGFKLLSLIHFCLWYNKFIDSAKVEK